MKIVIWKTKENVIHLDVNFLSNWIIIITEVVRITSILTLFLQNKVHYYALLDLTEQSCYSRTFQREDENLVLKTSDSFELTLYDGMHIYAIEEF